MFEIMPLDSDSIVRLYAEMIEDDAERGVTIFQIRGHFIMSHLPVLNALRKSDFHALPMKSILFPTAGGQHEEADEDEVNIVQRPVDRQPRRGGAQDIFVDLRDLFPKPDSISGSKPRMFRLGSSDEMFNLLSPYLSKDLIVDESQLRAVLQALLSNVCLIQGPPGTGKTYVGLRIAAVLLRNATVLGIKPKIFCVCYTYHALDQFLQELVDSKVCSFQDIARIGSRSTNENLQSRSLRKICFESSQATSEFTRSQRMLKQEANELEGRLSDLMVKIRQLRDFDGSHDSLSAVILGLS